MCPMSDPKVNEWREKSRRRISIHLWYLENYPNKKHYIFFFLFFIRCCLFLWRAIVNVVGFVRYLIHDATIKLFLLEGSNYRPYVNKWVWLRSNELYLQKEWVRFANSWFISFSIWNLVTTCEVILNVTLCCQTNTMSYVFHIW